MSDLSQQILKQVGDLREEVKEGIGDLRAEMAEFRREVKSEVAPLRDGVVALQSKTAVLEDRVTTLQKLDDRVQKVERAWAWYAGAIALGSAVLWFVLSKLPIGG